MKMEREKGWQGRKIELPVLLISYSLVVRQFGIRVNNIMPVFCD